MKKQFMILGNRTDGKNILSATWYAEWAINIEEAEKQVVNYFTDLGCKVESKIEMLHPNDCTSQPKKLCIVVNYYKG